MHSTPKTTNVNNDSWAYALPETALTPRSVGRLSSVSSGIIQFGPEKGDRMSLPSSFDTRATLSAATNGEITPEKAQKTNVIHQQTRAGKMADGRVDRTASLLTIDQIPPEPRRMGSVTTTERNSRDVSEYQTLVNEIKELRMKLTDEVDKPVKRKFSRSFYAEERIIPRSRLQDNLNKAPESYRSLEPQLNHRKGIMLDPRVISEAEARVTNSQRLERSLNKPPETRRFTEQSLSQD